MRAAAERAVSHSVATLTVGLLYWFPVRRWFSRWGSSDVDLARVMPGDVANPTYSATLGVTIKSSPELVWRWLVQMGYRRGGLYSYDWLDRLFGYLDAPSVNRILPEFQRLNAGDEIPIGRGGGFPVKAVDANRALVLGGEGDGFAWVWQFGLYPIGERRTRLVSRNSVRVHRPALWSQLFRDGFLAVRASFCHILIVRLEPVSKMPNQVCNA
jgi:hypothetical protein